MIKFSCHICFATYYVKDKFAGKRAKCKCGEILRMPGDAVAQVAPSKPITPSAPVATDTPKTAPATSPGPGGFFPLKLLTLRQLKINGLKDHYRIRLDLKEITFTARSNPNHTLVLTRDQASAQIKPWYAGFRMHLPGGHRGLTACRLWSEEYDTHITMFCVKHWLKQTPDHEITSAVSSDDSKMSFFRKTMLRAHIVIMGLFFGEVVPEDPLLKSETDGFLSLSMESLPVDIGGQKDQYTIRLEPNQIVFTSKKNPDHTLVLTRKEASERVDPWTDASKIFSGIRLKQPGNEEWREITLVPNKGQSKDTPALCVEYWLKQKPSTETAPTALKERYKKLYLKPTWAIIFLTLLQAVAFSLFLSNPRLGDAAAQGMAVVLFVIACVGIILKQRWALMMASVLCLLIGVGGSIYIVEIKAKGVLFWMGIFNISVIARLGVLFLSAGIEARQVTTSVNYINDHP